MTLAPAIARIGRGTADGARRAASAFWDDVPPKERLARTAALAAVCWVVGGVVLAERRALWVLLAAWCIAAWRAGRTEARDDEQPEDEPELPDADEVAHLVRELLGDAKGVLLTGIRDHFEELFPGGWTTKNVRALLADSGIPVRAGVRTPAGNGPAVHRDDLPPLPSPATAPVGVVAAGQDANTNTNNTVTVEEREGMTIIRHPADRHRWHDTRQGVNGS